MRKKKKEGKVKLSFAMDDGEEDSGDSRAKRSAETSNDDSGEQFCHLIVHLWLISVLPLGQIP